MNLTTPVKTTSRRTDKTTATATTTTKTTTTATKETTASTTVKRKTTTTPTRKTTKKPKYPRTGGENFISHLLLQLIF